jgi:hypothetical protein
MFCSGLRDCANPVGIQRHLFGLMELRTSNLIIRAELPMVGRITHDGLVRYAQPATGTFITEKTARN